MKIKKLIDRLSQFDGDVDVRFLVDFYDDNGNHKFLKTDIIANVYYTPGVELTLNGKTCEVEECENHNS